MKLKFKGNKGNIPDKESKRLAEFVLNHRNFLGLSLSILEARRQPIKPEMVEDVVIKGNPRFEDELLHDKNYQEFVKLVKDVYCASRGVVSNRRGYILELIWDVAGTVNNDFYNKKIENSKVIHNNAYISESDIDIVYCNIDKCNKHYKFIELQECKARIEHKVTPPIEDADMKKLELMRDTVEIANKENITCNSYIVTYERSSFRTATKLRNLNFPMIKIITRGQIENIVNQI